MIKSLLKYVIVILLVLIFCMLIEIVIFGIVPSTNSMLNFFYGSCFFVGLDISTKISYKTIWKNTKEIILCKLLNHHDWTANVFKQISPTKEQIEGGMVGFADYCKLYCDRCGKISHSSMKQILENQLFVDYEKNVKSYIKKYPSLVIDLLDTDEYVIKLGDKIVENCGTYQNGGQMKAYQYVYKNSLNIPKTVVE